MHVPEITYHCNWSDCWLNLHSHIYVYVMLNKHLVQLTQWRSPPSQRIRVENRLDSHLNMLDLHSLLYSRSVVQRPRDRSLIKCVISNWLLTHQRQRQTACYVSKNQVCKKCSTATSPASTDFTKFCRSLVSLDIQCVTWVAECHVTTHPDRELVAVCVRASLDICFHCFNASLQSCIVMHHFLHLHLHSTITSPCYYRVRLLASTDN